MRPSKLELLTTLGVHWERLPSVAVSKYIARNRRQRWKKREEYESVAKVILFESLPSLRMSGRPEGIAQWLLQRLVWGLGKWDAGQRTFKRGLGGSNDVLFAEDPRLQLEERHGNGD